jgi:integrase
MATSQPIRDKAQAREFIAYFRNQGQIRNWLLATLGIHTALRISDILRLKTNDVYDFAKGCLHKSISLKEKKTGKSKTVALHKNIITALEAFLPYVKARQALIFNERTGKAISRVQAYRIFRGAAEALRLGQRVGCHSLRKTFGYHAWKNDVSPAILMEIYNHNSFATTRRYLGVSQDDKDAVYLAASF